MKVIMNWSGGKDSALSLFKVLQQRRYEVKYLLTSLNEKYKRISMHGVCEELLEKQAAEINIPLVKLMMPENASMEVYNRKMTEALSPMIDEGIEASVFGDIFLEDLKQYRIEQLKKVNMQTVFPLWKRNTLKLAEEFIDRGFKTIISCVNNDFLPPEFAGRVFDKQFLADLPANVDPCGENGEFHSFVFDGPLFKSPIRFTVGEKVQRSYPSPDSDNKHTEFTFIELSAPQ